MSVQARETKSTVKNSDCLLSWMEKDVQKFPEKSMVISQTTSLSYRHGFQLALDIVHLLKEAVGVKPVVAISVHNIVEFPSLLAALEVLGSTMVLLPPSSAQETLDNAINMFHPTLFVTDSVSHCAFMKAKYPRMHVLTSGFKYDHFACIQQLQHCMTTKNDEVDPALAESACVALFSSGSTGKPKAIINKCSSFGINGALLLRALHYKPHDVLYVPVPYFHVYGLLGVAASIVAGLTLVSSEHYRPSYSLSLIQRYNVTLYFGVSTMFLREMRLAECDDNPAPHLRAALSAGAPMPKQGFKNWEKKFQCKLTQAYGMTETAATVTVTDIDEPDDVRINTVGLPVGGSQVKVDPKTSEIFCKTPRLATGIMHDSGIDPLETHDGWFATGDLGHFEGKNLVIDGRLKDMIIRGGINIFPAEVEKIYQDLQSVIDCRLVGYPDEELGERTCLFVVPGKNCPTDDILRQFAKGKIERFKIPDIVVTVDTMPKLPNGKLDVPKLRSMAEEVGKTRGLC